MKFLGDIVDTFVNVIKALRESGVPSFLIFISLLIFVGIWTSIEANNTTLLLTVPIGTVFLWLVYKFEKAG